MRALPGMAESSQLPIKTKVGALCLIAHQFGITEWDSALEVVKNKEGVKEILQTGRAKSKAMFKRLVEVSL
jgi:hypothetical protein